MGTSAYNLFRNISKFIDFYDSNDITWDKAMLPKLFRTEADVAEWIRRLTRNQFPTGRVGFNPSNCEKCLFLYN